MSALCARRVTNIANSALDRRAKSALSLLMNETDGNTLLEPARTIIERFSTSEACGVSVVSEEIGTAYTTVRRWMYSKKKKGTGGLIPPKRQQDLLALAERRRVELRPEDFVSHLKERHDGTAS